jgi:Ricin-type beta-trefoil lectin domain
MMKGRCDSVVRNLKRLSVLVVVVLATVVGVQSVAVAHSRSDEQAFVRNAFHSKCLAVQGLEWDAFVWDCRADFRDQLWRVVKWTTGPTDFYQIRNVQYPYICLAVRGQQGGNIAKGVQCNINYGDQLWYIYDVGAEHGHELVNYSSWKCLATHGGVAFQWNCNESWTDQRWYLYAP